MSRRASRVPPAGWGRPIVSDTYFREPPFTPDGSLRFLKYDCLQCGYRTRTDEAFRAHIALHRARQEAGEEEPKVLDDIQLVYPGAVVEEVDEE